MPFCADFTCGSERGNGNQNRASRPSPAPASSPDPTIQRWCD